MLVHEVCAFPIDPERLVITVRRIGFLTCGALLAVLLLAGLSAGCGSETPTTLAPTTTIVSGTTGIEWPDIVWKSYNRSGEMDVEAFKASAAGQKSAEYQKLFFLFKDEMDPAVLGYYEGLGIKKEMHDASDPDLKWASYTPLPALEDGNETKYPVVFDFVGGERLIFSAEGHGFVHNAYKYGYIAVLPANPVSNQSTAITPGEQVVRILDALEEQGYPIDRSRVYVVGMSAGGVATAYAGLEEPDVIAAVAMQSSLAVLNSEPSGNFPFATPADSYTEAMDYGLPMLAMAGDNDFGMLPITEQTTVDGLNKWLQVNSCPTEATLVTDSTDPAVQAIGVEGDSTWTETIDGVVHYGTEWNDADGVKKVEIICVTNLSHWPSGTFPDIAWEFLSRFSRDADGKLVVAE